jgi:hypothetical protein
MKTILTVHVQQAAAARCCIDHSTGLFSVPGWKHACSGRHGDAWHRRCCAAFTALVAAAARALRVQRSALLPV